MIIIGNSFTYFIIVLVIFYILRKRHKNDDTPAIVDGIISLFWPWVIILYILYYIFKFVNNLAKR